jgi:peptidyl-prolyl cis-trans isomerase B (cyclophilin B)
MAPSFLKATGIGINMPSIFLSLGIGAPFRLEPKVSFRTHIATPERFPPEQRFDFGAKVIKIYHLVEEAIMAEPNPTVTIATSMGNIRIELDAEKAPITTKNFLDYVADGYYDGLIFHRVIPGFMIQGGGMDPQMKQKGTKSPIKNEATNGLKNKNGSIAMARTNVVDSATAQFFINVKDNDFLDHRSTSADAFGYAVFGQVIDGMDVVQKIEKVKTRNSGMHQDVPVDPVLINSVKLDA